MHTAEIFFIFPAFLPDTVFRLANRKAKEATRKFPDRSV